MPAGLNLALSFLVAGAATYSATAINLGDVTSHAETQRGATVVATASAPLGYDAPMLRPHALIGGDAIVPVSFSAAEETVYDRLQPGPELDAVYCTKNEEMYDALQADFAEVPKLNIKRSGGMSYQLWASEFLGTWTALRTDASGTSCVIATGVDWEPTDDPQTVLSLALNAH